MDAVDTSVQTWTLLATESTLDAVIRGVLPIFYNFHGPFTSFRITELLFTVNKKIGHQIGDCFFERQIGDCCVVSEPQEKKKSAVAAWYITVNIQPELN